MSLEPSGLYYCHRCSVGGKLKSPPDHSVAILAESTETAHSAAKEPPDGYTPLGWEPGVSSVVLAPARAYAARRHIPTALARTLQVGATVTGYYSGRIVIPLLDSEGIEWCGWVARDYTGKASKPYLYPRGMSRERLYNHDAIYTETDEPLIVVEGVLDAIPFWPHGVAVLGKPSEAQIQALASAKRPVAVVLDGDAHSEGWALAMRLRFEGVQAGYVKLPPRTDPDECIDFVKERSSACITEGM